MPTNTMVENIVAIELAYVNTRHPDFYKDMANISSMLKSPDLETERMNQVRFTFRFKTFLIQSLSLHVCDPGNLQSRPGWPLKCPSPGSSSKQSNSSKWRRGIKRVLWFRIELDAIVWSYLSFEYLHFGLTQDHE